MTGPEGVRVRGVYAVILSLAFVVILVTAVESYRAIDRELTEAVLSKQAALAEMAAVTLSEKLERLVDLGVSLADRVRFRELIGVGQWVEASRILARVRTEFPFVDRITLNDTLGTLRADLPAVPEVLGRNFADRDWYRGVSHAWIPYVSNVYRRAVGSLNVFGVAVPIRSLEGTLLGSLLLQVRLDTLFEWTRHVDVGREGYLYIVDRRGTVAFHPRFPPKGNSSISPGSPPSAWRSRTARAWRSRPSRPPRKPASSRTSRCRSSAGRSWPSSPRAPPSPRGISSSSGCCGPTA